MSKGKSDKITYKPYEQDQQNGSESGARKHNVWWLGAVQEVTLWQPFLYKKFTNKNNHDRITT